MVRFITHASFVDDKGVFRYAGEEITASKETYDKQVELTRSAGWRTPELLDSDEESKQVEPPKPPVEIKQPEPPKPVKVKQVEQPESDL